MFLFVFSCWLAGLLCSQVLKRDSSDRVTLAVATIPALSDSVFPGPKGAFSFICSVFGLK